MALDPSAKKKKHFLFWPRVPPKGGGGGGKKKKPGSPKIRANRQGLGAQGEAREDPGEAQACEVAAGPGEQKTRKEESAAPKPARPLEALVFLGGTK